MPWGEPALCTAPRQPYRLHPVRCNAAHRYRLQACGWPMTRSFRGQSRSTREWKRRPRICRSRTTVWRAPGRTSEHRQPPVAAEAPRPGSPRAAAGRRSRHQPRLPTRCRPTTCSVSRPDSAWTPSLRGSHSTEEPRCSRGRRSGRRRSWCWKTPCRTTEDRAAAETVAAL